MTSLNFIQSYKLCSKCNKEMTSTGIKFCKDCKPKKEYNRTLNKCLSKAYLHKFEIKNILHNNGTLEATKASGLIFYDSIFGLNKEIVPPTNKESDHFFYLYWDKFNDFDSFSSFIAKSGQISSSYFVFSSLLIQKNPKFKHFIESKENKLPVILPSIQILPSIPLSRPLHLLTQKSYWDNLIKNYFQHIHSIIPIFSIHSFNPRTVAKSLLSAIYYGGFQCMQDKPPELIRYFNEYSKINVKETIRRFSLQSTQAINLYAFLFVLTGEYTLSRYCQSHAIRMGYALGLHIDLKRLTPIQKYDRIKLFSSIFTTHISTYSISHYTLNQLTEYEDINIDLLKPEYQIPNSNCAFYFDTRDENVVYGICTDTYYKIFYMIILSLWEVIKYSESYVNSESDKIFSNLSEKYSDLTQVYDILSKEYPHLKPKILSIKLQHLTIYRTMILETYRILKNKSKILKPSQVSKIISECCILFDSIVESKEFVQVTYAFPYTVGLNLFNLYPISNSQQRSLIKQKIGEILNFLSDNPCADKLSYLIIKNEYESIENSEDNLIKTKIKAISEIAKNKYLINSYLYAKHIY